MKHHASTETVQVAMTRDECLTLLKRAVSGIQGSILDYNIEEQQWDLLEKNIERVIANANSAKRYLVAFIPPKSSTASE